MVTGREGQVAGGMLPVHDVYYPQHLCFSTQPFHNYMGQRKTQ